MYDVSVAGPGGMGSAAAYQLARRGLPVLGLEKYTLAHGHGSSHGRFRVIRQVYFEDPSYVLLLFSGSVQIIEHNLPYELLEADKLRTRFAWRRVLGQ